MSGARRYLALAHERFPPDALLRQAARGERAGFDGICCTDVLQPRRARGESGQAWAWLGAAGAITQRAALGTAGTAVVHRYHPAVVAQAFATLQIMFPGRVFLGAGPGDRRDETAAGMRWPEPDERLARLDEALAIIGRLLDGDTVSLDGEFFRVHRARLRSLPRRRVPVYVRADDPAVAAVAAYRGDGLWTTADPTIAGPAIAAYREERARLGREEGEILVQQAFSWAAHDDAALDAAGPWDDGPLIAASDPGEHAERVREMERMGATIAVLANVSGADPERAIDVYGEAVLPALRGVRVGSAWGANRA